MKRLLARVGGFLERTCVPGGKYRQLWSPRHVQEIAGVLRQIRADALADIETDWDRPLDELPPGAGGTSFGLVLLYSCTRLEDGRHEHYASLSSPTRYLATYALETLGLLLIELLGPPEVDVGISPNRVVHVAFDLTPAAHASYAREPLPSLSLDQARALMRHVHDEMRASRPR